MFIELSIFHLINIKKYLKGIFFIVIFNEYRYYY